MSMTSDLADQYVAAASDLDSLYTSLVSAKQYGLASQVSQAENDLKQAASSLYSMDAIVQLDSASANAATITQLTSLISQKAAAIAASQGRVTIVTGLAASLVTLVSDFGAGNIVGGIGAAGDAIGALNAIK